MILGIGNDILEIERVREACKKQGSRFLKRILTKKEQEYCNKFKDPFPHIAARFSAKEAIVKAFGSGFGKNASWLDIEIINNTQGKPEVYLSAALKKRLKKSQLLISISHCKLYVTTTAIWSK
jgi:holo-[acyl-carrier protein] synthase